MYKNFSYKNYPEIIKLKGLNGFGTKENNSNSSIIHTVTAGETGSITSGSIYSYNNFNVIAKDITVNKADGTGVQTSLDSKNHTFSIDFYNKFDVNMTDKGHGIVANAPNATIDIDGNGTGSLSVIADENAVSLSRRDDYKNSNGNVIRHVENNKINIHDVVDVYIESKGEDEGGALDRGHAIYAHNDGGEIAIDASNDITVKAIAGKNAVKTDNDAKVNLTAGNNITVTGTVQGNFDINAQKGTLKVTTTGDNKQYGLYAQSDKAYLQSGESEREPQLNVVNVKELNVNSAGMALYAHGAHLNVNAETVNLTSGDGGIYVDAYPNGGDKGPGITVKEGAGSVTMNVTKALNITAAGNGVSLASNNPDKKINILGTADITINADGNGVYTRYNNSPAKDNAINITGSTVKVTSTGKDEGETKDTKGHAVFANGSAINILANERIELTAEMSGKNAIYAN